LFWQYIKRILGSGAVNHSLTAVVFEFLEADTPGKRRDCVAAHPELLDPDADALFSDLMTKARRAGRNDIAEKLVECRIELARVRPPSMGESPRPAEPRPGGKDQTPPIPAELKQLLAEARMLGPETDPQRRVDVMRRAVRLADPRIYGEQRAALQSALSAALAELGRSLARRTGEPGGNLETAIECLTEALSPDGRLPPKPRAEAQAELANVYLRRLAGNRTDNIECAIECLKAAAEVFTRPDPSGEWADIHCDLGIAFRERIRGDRDDNLDRAIQYFQEVRNSEARELQPVTYARACDGLGTAYLDRVSGVYADNVEQAIGYYTEACEILAKFGFTVERAAAQHNLGNAYIQWVAENPADNVELAIERLQDALTVRTEEVFPLEWAETRHALGNAYLHRGRSERAHNIETAITAFRDAATAFARIGAARQEAVAQQALAQAYFSRIIGDRDDNIEQAVSCLRAALASFASKGMIVEQAAALTGLGNALSEWKAQDPAALDRAVGCHSEALRVLGDSAASPAIWAVIQNNLGTAYRERHSAARREDLASAIACFQDSLTVGSGTRSSLEQAMTRHNLGVAYAERADEDHPGDLPDAIAQFVAALEVFATVGLPGYRRASGQALGDAYTRLGEHWPETFGAYEIALEAANDMYVSSLRREAREAELAESRGLHPQAAFAAAMTGDLEQAVVILERGRARGLGDTLTRDVAELDDIPCELADAFLTAAAELRGLERMDWRSAAETRGRGPGGALLTAGPGLGTGGEDELRQGLEAARTRLNETIADIRGLKGHEQFLAQPEFSDVASAVAKVGPLAYLAVTAAGSLTLLVAKPAGAPNADGMTWPTVERVAGPAEPLTSEALGSLLIHRDGDTVTGGYLPEQMAITGSTWEFRQALEELLRRDGKLRCLLDDFAVSYAPSARVLAAAGSAPSAQPGLVPVLAGIGDPAGAEPSLPFARAEMKEISAYFAKPRAFYGSQATKAALLEAARGATYVHFASHGLFDPISPRDSALILAGDGEPDPLTLREVVADRPFSDACLVVASACETALTDFTHLPDETIGLPAGFLQAGTPAVVGTLWKVRDVSTALLMIRFYAYHLGPDGYPDEKPMPLDQALRQAQLWLARITAAELKEYISRHHALKETLDAGARIPRGERPFAHPFYWAPFVLVGA
jgi:tetratricopeptide (TPR) repeat protein